MSYKQFDREKETDIISDNFETTFRIYQLWGHDTWRVELSRFVLAPMGKNNKIDKTFYGFKTREEAIKFVNRLVHPVCIKVIDLKEK